MPKFSVNATELTDTDVNFVALVKRGANRIPFRLTKGDNEMLDLYSIGRRMFKSDEPAPVVIGAILQKGADVQGAVAILKSVGVDVSTFVQGARDGVVTFARKTDANSDEPEGVMMLKCAGGVTLAFANLQKSFQGHDFQSPDFGEVHAKGSHLASMSNAADSLHNTMGNIIDGATDPKDCADKMGAACDAYKNHVTKLTSALPTHAFKADQALMKAEVANLVKAGMNKTPHRVAMALAHANHATANAIGGMFQGGGTDDDQETGDTSGVAALQAKPAAEPVKKDDIAGGDVAVTDPEMPAKDPKVKKIDAGKNGTGAGFELGEGTGDTPAATADDQANTEVDAKPGAAVSGDSSGLPAKAKAPTKKSAVRAAQIAVAKAELALLIAKNEADGDVLDDDSTGGAQSGIPAKAKAPTKKDEIKGLPQPTGESAAGEGAAQAVDDRANVSDEDVTEAANVSKVKGKTLSLDGVPAKLIAPTTKNDGDAEIGKKGKGKTLDDSMSGAGAQETNIETMKTDAVMKAIQALSKSVQDGLAAVTESVKKTNARVEAVAGMAQKTDAALNGTVFNDADEDAIIRKGENGNAPPLMDTAYNRRTA